MSNENQGIGLYRIDYEMKDKEDIWQVGIIAYNQEEAVKALATFLKDQVKDFKGFKIDTLSYQGAVHHLSDNVRGKILEGYEPVKPKKKATQQKKSIMDKDKDKK
jgi:hypothetical protein